MLNKEPELYPAVAHIWAWFVQLSVRRGGGFGPAPLTYQELDAWARRLEIDPTPWEIEQIMVIDDVNMLVSSEKSANNSGAK